MGDGMRIAIIGAGFSGALLAVNLLRRFPGRVRVQLVERNREFGRGLAYATGNPNHLLNVRAGRMSAIADQPDHFIDWLRAYVAGQGAQDAQCCPDTFAPRRVYGTYIQALLDEAEHRGTGACSALARIHGEVVAVVRRTSHLTLRLGGGERLDCDVAVLATGHCTATRASGQVFANPWDPSALEGLPEDAPVLLVGTGLTMVDTVVSLLDRGHRGDVVALSRRGLLPRPHADAQPRPPPDFTAIDTTRLTALLHATRQATRTGGRERANWRGVVDALRPQTQALWRALPTPERQRFLRHARPWWDAHRHRMAPEVARLVDRQVRKGSLRVLAGRIHDMQPGVQGVQVRWSPRRSRCIESLDVARVIDCSGPECDYDRIDSALVRHLLQEGLARPDALHLGLDVDADSALVARDGRVAGDLYALGPVTRGTFWEITSVPDIREQCWQLADHVAPRVDARVGTPAGLQDAHCAHVRTDGGPLPPGE